MTHLRGFADFGMEYAPIAFPLFCGVMFPVGRVPEYIEIPSSIPEFRVVHEMYILVALRKDVACRTYSMDDSAGVTRAR